MDQFKRENELEVFSNEEFEKAKAYAPTQIEDLCGKESGMYDKVLYDALMKSWKENIPCVYKKYWYEWGYGFDKKAGIPYNGIFSVTYVDGLNISLFPIQIAETISFLVIFIVCNSLKKNKWITYITLIVTILTKLFLDMLRYDHLRILITPNQIASIVLLVIVIAVYIYNFAKSLKV